MTIGRLVYALFIALLATLPTAPAQQPPATPSSSQRIKLDVVVDTKAGQPVPNLDQQDFTILDNKSPRPITSFKVVTAAEEPVEVILFIDAVNTSYQTVAYMRDNVEKFLKMKEGTLAYPTTIAVLTDQGVQIDNNGFSTNGFSLSDVLEHYQIGLREFTQSTEWSEQERLNICLRALRQIVTFASNLPGRKMILWISPGWPLISGTNVSITPKLEQHIFGDVVFFSSQMQQADITLYNINPFGVSESMLSANSYQAFVKGLAKPGDAQLGNLGLQVFAVHSGGLVLVSSSDVTAQIEKCLRDAGSWYEITFDPTPADKPNEYHHIEIKLDQRDFVARTRDGYYSNPVAAGPMQ
ncbi:MAG: VWA domain-containing protein [Terracidiphilus sp.]